MSKTFVFYLTAVCAFAINCNSSTDDVVPTSASRVDNAAGSTSITTLPRASATVTGTVQNLTTPRALEATRQMDTAGLRVFVVGAGLSAEVNPSGQFTLEVPSDFVELSFQGPGVDAPLVLGVLRPGQRIHIAVIVNGRSARLAELRGGDRDGDRENRHVEVEGIIARLNGDCPLVSFMVGNAAVKTNIWTNTDDGCSDLRNGIIVEVTGTRQRDGSVLASRIELEDEDDDDDTDDRRRR